MPKPRVARWVDNFAHRHGETSLAVADGALRADPAGGLSAESRGAQAYQAA